MRVVIIHIRGSIMWTRDDHGIGLTLNWGDGYERLRSPRHSPDTSILNVTPSKLQMEIQTPVVREIPQGAQSVSALAQSSLFSWSIYSHSWLLVESTKPFLITSERRSAFRCPGAGRIPVYILGRSWVDIWRGYKHGWFFGIILLWVIF